MEVEEEQAAAEGGKMPASEEEKNQAREKYSTSTTEGVGISINRKGMEQPKIDQGAEKRCNDKKSHQARAVV